MLRTTVSLLIAIAIIAHLSIVPVLATNSDSKHEKKAAKVASDLRQLGTGESVRVNVKLYDKTSYKGYVREATDESFVIVDEGGSPHSVKYVEVKSVKGKNLSTGAKIGIGIAIGAGITLLIVALIVHSND